MKTLLFWCTTCLLAVGTIDSQAQQIVCERVLMRPGLMPYTVRAIEAPASGLLLVGQGGTTTTGGAPGPNATTHLYLARLNSSCDTLWQRWLAHTTDDTFNTGLTADARSIWVLTGDTVHDFVNQRPTARPRLWQFSNNGLLRRIIRPFPLATSETPVALLSAADGGCYASVDRVVSTPSPPYYLSAYSILRFDSTGNLRWRREYGAAVGLKLNVLAHSLRGTVLLAGTAPYTAFPNYAPMVLEAETSRGDSVAGAFVSAPAGAVTEDMRASNASPYTVLPLTSGQGYILTTVVTPNNGRTPPPAAQVVCLDPNFALRWRYALPTSVPGANRPVTFTQVRELADGTLLALARPQGNFSRQAWLYRLSAATGTLLNVYPVAPQVAPFVRPDYLLPVPADSTLMLAGPAFAATTSQPAGLYVARVRIQGLPRVVAAPVITLATTRQARAALALHCYPNPATDELHVRYALAGAAAARLEVRDMLGRVVWQQPASAGGATVPVRGLAPGLYLVALVDAGQTLAARRVAVQP